MTPNSVTTQTPYKLQMWPAHLLLAAAFGAAALTIAHPSATRQQTWPWAPLLALLWLTPLVAAAGRLAFLNSWTWPSPLLKSGLFLLAGATLLSAAVSPFAQLSLLRIWPTLAGTALFFWLHDWLAESAGETPDLVRRLGRGLAGFGALLAVSSVAGWIWHNGGVVWSARNEFPFGHSIYTAGALLLILPWLVAATLKTRGLRRTGWALAAALGFLALLATSSRGGVLAAGAVGVAAAGFALVRAAWSRRIKTVVVAAAVVFLAVAVGTNPRLRELTRGQGWSESARESNGQRNAMLEAGAILGAARPLIGWGPGTVPLAYPQVRHRLSGGVDNVLELHNTPVQLWATLGGGGIVALALLLAAFARRSWQIAVQPASGTATLAAAASLLGFGLFALTDHQLDLPAMNALLAVNSALFFVDGRGPGAASVTRGAKWGFSLALIIVSVVPLLLAGRDLLARYAYDQSLILFDDGRPAEGLEYLETAAQRAPYDPYYRHQLAGRLLEQRARAKDQTERARLTAEATGQLEQSLAAGCLQEFAHFNLGWLALEAGEPARAIPHFLATVHEAPHRGGAYFGLGLALRGTGNESAAVRAFALEWINDPIAFTAPLWEWPDFAQLRPQIVREADALLAGLAAVRPAARYVRELFSWWERGGSPPADGFNAETADFTRTVAANAQNQPAPFMIDNYGWGRLLGAWWQPPEPNAFAKLTQNDAAFAATLARRGARHRPPDLHGFLTAGLENEPALLIDTRFSRPGYGVLALHPDGPVLTNLYVMQQNRLVATFAPGLFPPKGWLPADALLTRLPALPATP